MSESSPLEAQLHRLNPEQRQAAETLDGPLMVIAGPGTGKTQLLSVRAANILAKRDVTPQNILCLTYTEAGAEAMRRRLVELIGRPGYDIEVSTFHSFSQRLRGTYPEYFDVSARVRPASDLERARLLNSILRALNPKSPLYSGKFENVSGNLGDVTSAIDNLKRMGITPSELRAIARQNADAVAYLQQPGQVVERYFQAKVPSAKDAKQDFVHDFEAAVDRLSQLAPKELTKNIVGAPGIYQPYLLWFADCVREAELLDANGNTGPFAKLRDALCMKQRVGAATVRVLKAGAQAQRALALADVYERYLARLGELELIDYQDMINLAVTALREHPEFAAELQERYRYLQVDEFQDTNGSQMRLIQLICPPAGDAAGARPDSAARGASWPPAGETGPGSASPNVMVVGDDDQAIMRFQGASVEGIRQFSEVYRPVSVVLTTNYRSTPALVELGQEVVAQVENRLISGEGKRIVAHRTEDEQDAFPIRRYMDASSQYDAVARSIRARIDEGFLESAAKPGEAIAVIAAKHRNLKDLIPYLKAHGVPFSYKVRTQVSQMESMQALLALLRCVSALAQGDVARAEAELPEIVASPELGLAREESVAFAIEARTSRTGWLAALGKAKNPKLRALAEDLVTWAAEAPSAPVRQLFHRIAERSIEHYESVNAPDPLARAEFQSGIRALLKAVTDELDGAARTKTALRLPEVMDTFDAMCDFDVQIDASVALGQPDAVTLTTAHGSKGLEFDLVYVIDADDGTWHGRRPARSPLPSNILTGTDPDDDDQARLLFVAITRARRLLWTSSAKGESVRELQGITDLEECEVDPSDLPNIIEVDWRGGYELATPELAALVPAPLAPRHLSASSLNSFVDYEKGCANSSAFPMKRIFHVPDDPSESLEFGTLVHAFLQDYVTQVRGKGKALDGLVERYGEDVRWLDFPAEDVKTLEDRFERIAQSFVPALAARLDEASAHDLRVFSEANVNAVTPGGVPLFGKCDLLLVNDAQRTIEVIDYKTGSPKNRLTMDYERQLLFYMVLVENSPDFAGYTVVQASDVPVEPRNRTEGELGATLVKARDDEELEQLNALIAAVWKRVGEGRFTTSEFEELPEVQRLWRERPRGYRKKLQELYEAWLIDTA